MNEGDNKGGKRDEKERETPRASSDGEKLGATTESASPSVADTSGVGLLLTIVTGVLLAFGYYGVRSAIETGFGQVVPPPFYLLAVALLFVIELTRIRSFGLRGLLRIVGNTTVFGALVVLAIEGGAYLWEQPEAAVDEFEGVVVLAVSLVVAALAYAIYLSAIESTAR